MEKPLSKMHVLLIILVSITGLALTILATNNSMNAIKTKSWPTTQGTIISSEVTGLSRYTPKVSYTYTVGTNEYTSDKFELTNTGQYKHKADAIREADRYPVNAKVTVYYNPLKVDEAILNPGIKGEHVFMFLIGLIIFVAPIIGLIYTYKHTPQ